jgi:hypothetical protein
MKKFLLGAVIACAVPLVSGCGGGSSNFSGPNSNSAVGTGTVIVNVKDPSGGSVPDGAAVVFLEKLSAPVKSSRAVFYNVKPGKYFVQARTQSIGLPGDSQNIEIKADMTLTINLST